MSSLPFIKFNRQFRRGTSRIKPTSTSALAMCSRWMPALLFVALMSGQSFDNTHLRQDQVNGDHDQAAIKLEEQDGRLVFVIDPSHENVERHLVTLVPLNNSVFVRTVNDGQPSSIPLFGRAEMVGDSICFVPRYPLRPGMTYRVQIAIEGDIVVQRDFELSPVERDSTTFVERIYPTQDWVPENLLKFYVEFSAPMSRGRVYQHARILDADGNEVEYAFLHIDEELWSTDGSRITLLFDPGRIKRELRPRQELGSPLREGNRYSLEIDAEWEDANGNPLIEAIRKEFEVREHDDVCPDPSNWELELPQSKSQDRLTIAFPEALDAGMLLHAISVEDSTGQRVEGDIILDSDQTRWHFEPDVDWGDRDYHLVIATNLEDLAGNTIQQPFEVDLTVEFTSPYPDETTSITFRPTSPPETDR